MASSGSSISLGLDLSVVPALVKRLKSEGWSDIEPWRRGVRAWSGTRRTIFGTVHPAGEAHVRDQVRSITLDLLQHRFEAGGGDALCLATDGALGVPERGLLGSAGIGWIQVPRLKKAGPLASTGMGDDTKKPTGRILRLPSRVSVKGPIRGWRKARKGERVAGSGAGWVDVAVSFTNTSTSEPMVIVLPAGFVMISTLLKSQNGILAQEVTIVVPPGSVVHVHLRMYCANRSRDAHPSKFTVGPVKEDAEFQELFALLAGKVIGERETEVVQTAVWQLTDGEGLDSGVRKRLARL